MTTSITSLSATQSALQVNGVNAVVFDNTGITSGAPIGFRNRIINGDMRIDQRNAGAAVTPASSAYTLDRYFLGISQASKLAVQRVADAPLGFKYSLKVTVAAQYAPLATDQFFISQKVEGHNIIDFLFGTAGAQVITLSLWVKGSIAGTYACSLNNGAGNRSYTGTIPVTTTWSKQAVSLTCDTAGTWVTDSGIGAYFNIDLGSGTNQEVVPGVWAAANASRSAGAISLVNQVVGSTLNITGMQVELGGIATPFEQRPYGLELMLCQRYYEVIGAGSLYCDDIGGSGGRVTWTFKATKRVNGTVTLIGGLGALENQDTGMLRVYSATGIPYIGTGSSTSAEL